MTALRAAAPRTAATNSQLLLVINQTVYQVRPIAGSKPSAVRAFRLKKPDGTLYDIAQTPFGPECDCPDFVFRRDGLDPTGCKHVKALLAEGLIEGGTGESRGIDGLNARRPSR